MFTKNLFLARFTFAVASVLLTTAPSFSSPYPSQGGSPPTKTIPTVSGLNSATVSIDSSGIAHITAQTDEAMAYALGYMQLMRFPVTTLYNLWVGTGKLSTLVPTSSARLTDYSSLLWEHETIAREQEVALYNNSPTFGAYLKAFVQGVNDARAWYYSHPEEIAKLVNNTTNISTLAANFRTGSPALSLKTLKHAFHPEMKVEVWHVLSLGLFTNRGNIDSIINASNAWIIGGGASATGKPMMLTDPHVPVNDILMRGYFVEARGATYRAAGWSIPGWPCVVLGHSDSVSWAATAIPHPPITLNTWSAPDLGGHISFDLGSLKIESKIVPYQYWDELRGEIVTTSLNDPLAFSLSWVEKERTALAGRRYPIVGADAGIVYFQQSSAMTTGLDNQGNYQNSGSLFEFFFDLGRSTHVGGGVGGVDEIFKKNLWVLGSGINFLVCDQAGGMEYVLLARVPIQGDLSNVASGSTYPWQGVMDGTQSGYRWKGFHPFQDLPRQISTTPSSRAVWIMNNASPDLLVQNLSQPTVDPHNDPAPPPSTEDNTQTLPQYPKYIWDGVTISTYRQVRAHDILRKPIQQNINKKWTVQEVERIASDQVDNWGKSMWPLFVKTATQMGGEHLAFVQTMNAWMAEDKLAHNHSDLFTASIYSRTTPYLTLLRGIYEKEIGLLIKSIQKGNVVAPPVLPAGKSPLALGADPLLYSEVDEDEFVAADVEHWTKSAAAVQHALEVVVSDYFFDPDAQPGVPNTRLSNWKLASPQMSEQLRGCPTPAPWSDFPDDWERGYIRWGHVNMLVLTPLFLAPPPADERLSSVLFDIYFPAAFSAWPAFPPYKAEVFPVGGTKDSLFVTFSGKYLATKFGLQGSQSPLFTLPIPTPPAPIPGLPDVPVYLSEGNGAPGYVRYDQGVKFVPLGNREQPIYFVPHSVGSRTMLLMMHTNNGPVPRYMAAVGPTEVTADISAFTTIATGTNTAVLLGKASDHWEPSQDFADLVWRNLRIQAGTQYANLILNYLAESR
ncbi:MAG: penicillin acylase family protein [Planctomycetota bacterium]